MCAVCVSLSLLLHPSASEPDYKRVVLHRSDFSEETLQRFPRAFLIRFLDLSSRFLPFSFFFFISLFMFLLSRFRYVVFFSSSIPLPAFSGRLVLSLSLSFHASSLPFSLSVFPLSCPLSLNSVVSRVCFTLSTCALMCVTVCAVCLFAFPVALPPASARYLGGGVGISSRTPWLFNLWPRPFCTR